LKEVLGYLSGEERDRKFNEKLWERVYPSGLSEMFINIKVEPNVNLLMAGFGDLVKFKPSDDARIFNSLINE
jgi:hypothetical protein